MFNRKSYFPIWIIILALVLAACNGQATPVEKAAALDLTQTFSDVDVFGGTVDVQYPDAWFVRGDANNGIEISNVENLADTTEKALESGQVGISVIFIPNEAASLTLAEGVEATPSTVLASFIELFSGADDAPQFGSIEAQVLQESNVAVTTASGGRGDAFAILLEGESAFVLVLAASAEGEMNRWQATIEAIALGTTYQTGG